MRRIWAITRNTFREAVRNKILYSLLFFAVIIILSAVAVGRLSVNEELRMTRDIGLFGIDAEAARTLLTYAFVSDVLSRLKIQLLRDQLEAHLFAQIQASRVRERVIR